MQGLFALVATSAQPEVIVVEAGFNDRVAANLAKALADPAILAALRAGAALLLDSTHEGRPFGAALAERLHAMLAEKGLDSGRALMLTQNVNYAGYYAEWAAQQGIGRPMQVRTLHSLLRGMARLVRRMPAARSPAALDWPGEGAAKSFLCLNHRFAAHRAVVVGHLQASGAIGRGLVSVHRAPPAGPFAPAWRRTHQGKLAAFEALRPALPLTLPGTPGARFILGWEDRWYRETAFSLVTESEFLGPSVRRFTEKSLKPLAAGQPMLVAGQPGTLALLREAGFRSFAPIFREAYDGIEDAPRRMDAVLAEFDRLMALPDAELSAMLQELRPVLEHNMAWFRAGLPERLAREDREVHALLAGMARGEGGCA